MKREYIAVCTVRSGTHYVHAKYNLGVFITDVYVRIVRFAHMYCVLCQLYVVIISSTVI